MSSSADNNGGTNLSSAANNNGQVAGGGSTSASSSSSFEPPSSLPSVTNQTTTSRAPVAANPQAGHVDHVQLAAALLLNSSMPANPFVQQPFGSTFLPPQMDPLLGLFPQQQQQLPNWMTGMGFGAPSVDFSMLTSNFSNGMLHPTSLNNPLHQLLQLNQLQQQVNYQMQQLNPQELYQLNLLNQLSQLNQPQQLQFPNGTYDYCCVCIHRRSPTRLIVVCLFNIRSHLPHQLQPSVVFDKCHVKLP